MERASFARLKGLRVLVVDDHCDSADSLAMLFATAGCNARTAYTGSDALASMDDFDPQIVVLDVIMPEPDGYEVARQISARQHSQRPILVALSGYSHQNEEQKQRLKSCGFDQYFLKPADIRELFTRLSWAVAQRADHGSLPACQIA